jgi:uncharacterized repeat protein (TIGR01451 family)
LFFAQPIYAAEYFTGRVWYDLNKNGLEDAGEPGVQGVTVTLRGTAVTTNSNGVWTSVDLRSNSSYTVPFTNLPAGYIFTTQNVGSNDAIDSDPDPVTGVTGSYVATYNTTVSNIDAGIYLPDPEMDVKGGSPSQTILDGDVSPSVNDNTYFGNVDIVTGSVQHTFTIYNTGDGALNLDGSPLVSISGTHASDFSITTLPSTPVSANGGSTTFVITFNPSAAGSRTATVSIDNNDTDEDPYNFAIQGTGTATPEIDIKGKGISITDGDVSPSTTDDTDFTSADIYGGAHTHIFTIYNLGSGDLTLSGSPNIQITGSHAADFTVSQQPASSTVSPQGGTQTFHIIFDPTTTGLRQATVYITSNDGNENPFTFGIQGVGTINPEIDIKGNNLSITSDDLSPSTADSTNFGSVEIGSTTRIVTYHIYNTGPATLNLTGSWPLVSISGSHASDFDVYSAPASSIAPGGNTSFKISFDPLTAGTRSAVLTIANNDLSEGSYVFGIQGTGTYSTAPLSEIDIQVSLASIPSGTSAPSFGSVAVNGGSSSKTFTIKNTGTEDLLVTASPLAAISGIHASDFVVTQQPSSPIAPGASVPFTIAFLPSAGGTRSAYVSIENNDANESPYTITLTGTGFTSPEIQVKGNNLEIVSGDNTPSLTDSSYFGNVTASLGNKFVTYKIYNLGGTTLTLGGVSPVVITGAAASEFSVTTQPASSIAPNSSSSFVVKFDPAQVGLRNAAISIANDDDNENPYLFSIQGNGTGPGSPLACVPNFFHIYGDNGVIAYLDATTNPYTYTTIATAGYSINGMGYNLEDGLLYGFEQDATIAGDKIIRIDGTGAITVLTSVTVPFVSWRADFNDSGNMYFWNSTGTQIGIFDASTGNITTQNTSGAAFVPIDMAYIDEDGNFYGIQTTTLYKYNPSTHVVSTSSITGRLADEYNTGANSDYYGACWSANDGYLYSTNSQSGRMYKINVGTGESVYVGQGQANLNKSDGASCPLAEAPLPSTGSIGNRAWIDSDADGIQDANEVGLPGVTVKLYTSDDTFISSTMTNASGLYSFTNLAPSDYYLEFTSPPTGFSLTLQDQGSNNTLDSDVNPTTNRTADFFVSVGLIDEGLDAGYTATGFGNFVWNDLDYDGVQDVGEVGVPGVTVQALLASNNSVVATKTTDAYGAYNFTGLNATGYKLKISNLPGGYITTTQNAGGDDLKDSDVSASTGISGTYTLVSGQFNATVDAGIYQQTSPEINIKGNNVNIVDGDATPDLTDHTDFGSVSVASGTVVRTFTIQNVSGPTLTLNGTPIVAISGTHAADFTVTTQPNGTSITAGASKTFQVTFDPSALGERTAVISISNNDNNENPYDFSIKGTGLAPEMHMRGNDISIVDGDVTPATADGTNFGSADIASGQSLKTFKIFNLGSSALTLTGASPYVVFSGTHAAEFSVTAIPASSIAAGDSTFVTVKFDPAGIGVRTAMLSIANTDSDENPYNFNVQGTGTAFPEIQLEGNGLVIADDDITPSTTDHTDFGSLDIFSGSLVRTFTIRNNGSGNLALTGLPMVQISGTNAGDFIVSTEPSTGTVAASGTVTFQVTFDPTTTGLRKAVVNISNDDADENPYNFAIQGQGTSTLDQEIELLGGGLVIMSGDITPRTADNTDMGTGMISGVPISKTFVIRNVGYAVLNLTGPPPYVSLTGTHASEFNISSSPATAVGIDSATTSFVISFAPAGLGTRQATVNILNNDANESPYTFTVRGTGIYNPNSLSEIDVQGNFLSIPSGDTSPSATDGTNFGSVEVVGGYTSVRNFVIKNLGSEDLVLGNTPRVALSGTGAADFSVTTQPASPVSAGSSVNMSITFNPSATGTRTATVSIGNSDQNENPYTFTIQGEGTTVPEISLTGNGVTIANGDNTPSMGDSTYLGNVDVNLGVKYVTYTIHNSGSSSLTLTGVPTVNIIGDHASDYTVTSYPSSSINAGSSSSFVVAFDPAIVGLRNAAISITSNDSEETPYVFAIQGNGTGPGSPLACVPNFFHIYGSNGTIAYLDASSSPYVYTTIATAGFEINGVGYNLEDGLLYGFNMGTGDLIRIDGTGSITTLSSVSVNYESWRADFNDSGDMYFWNSTGTQVGIFDASAGSVSYQNTTGDSWTPIDMAYLESDGNFYGVQTTTLYKYNPNSHVVSTSTLTGKLVDDYNASTNSIYYGAAWSANDGYVYTTNSQSGRMYKINVVTDETIYVGQGVANLSSSDGASCPLAASPLPSTGTIGNFVWLDANDNGLQDAGEMGLGGVTVSIYDADDTFLGSQETASDGAYVFENLSPSEYYLTFTNPPAGFGLATKDVGTNNEIDSDVDPATSKTDVFTVDIGLIDNSIDAGFKATGVGDFVWLDADEDGIQDPGEAGVPGINVEIKLESNGTSVATTTTDATGMYCFKGLTNTTYRLYFTNLPAGYVFSPQNQGSDDALDSDIDPSNGQSPSFTLSTGIYNATIDAGVYQQSEPEIDIQGNNVSIPDGDVTPGAADHTDFGSISAVVDSVSRTFWVLNVSGADLTLNGSPKVVVSGTNANEFTVTTQPDATIVAGESTSFTVKFKPGAEGLRTALLSLANTDADENPYDFAIRGFGLASKISVTGDGNPINDGDTETSANNLTDFGSEDISTGSESHIFTIMNTGNANLVLTEPAPHITISGTHAADFSITSAPDSPVASNGSTNFTLTFNPVGEGVRTALVTIANNDVDENPFTFVVSGTGSATPEIALEGNGESIVDGDSSPGSADDTDFGSKDVLTGSTIHTFTIINPGSGSLLLTGTPMVALSGTHAGDFLVSTEPASATVAPDSGTVTFDITFNPTGVGLRTALVSIASNDADENPFTYSIQGTGVASSEIDVLGNNLSILNGDLVASVLDSTVFDSTIVDSAFSVTFTIKNQGSAVLNLTGTSPYVTIGGDHASDYAVTAIPDAVIASGGGTTTFSVTFTPSDEGARNAVISIASDDSDENPYTFAIQGVGLPTPQPELTLVETVDLAVAAPGDTLTYTVVYSNVGVGLATSVVLDQEIPDKTTYLTNSATGEGMVILFSHDNGSNYNTSQNAPVTHVRYQRVQPLPPYSNGTVSFRVIVD